MKHKVLPLISAIILFYFGIKKLTASEVSVTEFAKFGDKLGISPDLFMYFTGAVEMLTVLLIIGSVFIKSKEALFGFIGHAMLMGIMVGALLTEFVIRDTPKFPLVILAILLFGVPAFYAKNYFPEFW